MTTKLAAIEYHCAAITEKQRAEIIRKTGIKAAPEVEMLCGATTQNKNVNIFLFDFAPAFIQNKKISKCKKCMEHPDFAIMALAAYD